MHKLVPSLSCRLCDQAKETIVHLLSACPVLAPTAYLYRHMLLCMPHAVSWKVVIDIN